MKPPNTFFNQIKEWIYYTIVISFITKLINLQKITSNLDDIQFKEFEKLHIIFL